MKKFLLSLAVLFAGVATAQTFYSAGDAVTEFEENYPYLLSCDANGTRFLNDDGVDYLTKSSDLPTDAALIEFESAGTLEEDGETVSLYYIKFSDSGLYIADQAIHDGLDTSDMLDYKKPYIQTTDDVAFAAKWSVKPAETRNKEKYGVDGYMANWRVWTGQGDGSGEAAVPFENSMVIMRDKVSTTIVGQVEGDHDPVYLEVQGDYTFWASWGVNAWFISEPVPMEDSDLLYHWADNNLPENPEEFFETSVGDRIGMYDPASIEALKAAIEAFNAYDQDGEGDPTEILNALIAGMEALKVNEMKEGYYYLIAKRENSGVMDDGGVMRGVANFELPRKEDESIDLTLESSRYLWYFSVVPGKDNYLVKNFGTGKYVKTSAHNDNTGLKTGDIADAVPYNVEYSEEYPGTVVFKHYNANGERDCSWNYFWSNGKVIGNWYPEDDGNSFFLYGVDESLVKAIEGEVAQYELNTQLQAVYNSAYENYMKGRSYKAPEGITGDGDFVDHGFVKLTEAVDTAGNPVQTINVTCNAPESTEGYILALADNDYNTFFHSTWSAYGASPKPHNLIVDLGAATELPAIAIKILKRNTGEYNANRAVTKWMVYGTNDDPYNEEVAATWTAEGALFVDYSYDYLKVSGTDSTKVVNGVGMGAAGLSGAAYRYIRLDAVNNLNNEQNQFFAFSELGIWTATYDEATSLNTVVPAAILSALETQMAAAAAQLAAGKATEAQITALQKALDEFIKNFPEPQRLVDAVAAAETLGANLPADSEGEVGFYPEDEVVKFQEIVEEVKGTIAPVMTLDAINEGIAKIDAAKEAVLKTLVMPESGYYQIRVDAANYKDAILHTGRNAADTKDKKGLRADFAKLMMQVTDGDTTYVDNPQFTNSISSVWYVKVGEDNKLSIRSLGNGLYAQPCLAQSGKIQLAQEEAEITLQADGLRNGGIYNFIVGTDTVSGKTLYFNINSQANSTVGDLVAWGSAGGGDNSTFRLEPVSLEDFMYGENYFYVTAGADQFITFPYDAMYYQQPDDVKLYEVAGYYDGEENKAIYFNPIETGTQLVAGTPYLLRAGADAKYVKYEFEQTTVAESDFNYSYESKNVNGLVSTIFSTEVAPKFGVIDGLTRMIVSTKNTVTNGEEKQATIAPLSAYIDGNSLPILDAAPANPDAVMITTKLGIEGLNAIEGVEVVETAKTGVYTISGVRLNSAKNLPAGIYVINGKKVVK